MAALTLIVLCSIVGAISIGVHHYEAILRDFGWTNPLHNEATFPEPGPLPYRTYDERVDFIQESVRQSQSHQYHPIVDPTDAYNVFDCPLEPPENYPREYPIMDVLSNWPLLDLEDLTQRDIYQGLCVFDFHKTSHSFLKKQITSYRQAEVPFVVRNDPSALLTTERWNTGNYLFHKLQHKLFYAIMSKLPSMQYWMRTKNHIVPDNFEPPNYSSHLTFQKWYDMAMHNGQVPKSNKYKEHAYLRLDACYNSTAKCDSSYRTNARLSDADFIYQDVPVMNPDNPASDLYLVDKQASRGIQCRFGAKGLVAENHFDNERNIIGVFGGERRYLLGHAKNCRNMNLYPQKHPMERHSKVDWNAPNLTEYPSFANTTINEVVLQAGDLLYLPTYWFHHIVSLNINYQCNTRSGYSVEGDQAIYDCGFFYPFPS